MGGRSPTRGQFLKINVAKIKPIRFSNLHKLGFWARMGSPWLDMSPYLVTIHRMARTDLFKLVFTFFAKI